MDRQWHFHIRKSLRQDPHQYLHGMPAMLIRHLL